MPFPLKSAATLGGLLGLSQFDESEASPFGIKRFPKLFHGVRGHPELATESKENILDKGFLEGESAQYNVPGTSVTHDPWLAERVYTGQFAGLARGHTVGPNKDVVLGIDPLVQPSEVKNVSPALHVSGVAGDTLETNRLHSLPSFWHTESEMFAPRDENGIQRLIRPRPRNEIENKLIDDMVRVDENYINSAQRIMDYEKQAVANWKSSMPHRESTASLERQRYDKKRLVQDWITSLNALRGNESLFRQRFDIEFIGGGVANFGAPNPIKDIRGFVEPYQKVVGHYIDDALLGPNGEMTPKYKEYRHLRDSTKSLAEDLNEYNAFFKDPDEWTDEFKDLKDDMYRGGSIAKQAEQKLTDLYSTYYRRRDQLFNFLKENIGDMPRRSSRANLPAVGFVGGLSQYADYNIGEAKPTNRIQEIFQTNPIGQAATGFMRSPLETGAAVLDETQRIGSEFYGLPEKQSGTKILRYLEREGVIPRKTDSAWEILGGLVGL